MREAHLHLASLGESLSLLNLERTESLGECLSRLEDEARANAQKTIRRSGGARADGGCAESGSGLNDATNGCRWLRAIGVRTHAWPEARWPTLKELDAATGEIPTVVMSFDHHTAVANSAAMHAAGLSPAQSIPPNGLVCADRNGHATGLLHEQAAYMAWNAAPEPSMGERKRDLLRALKLLGAMGFTQVHDLHSQSWLGPMLGELDRAGTLSMEVSLFAPAARLSKDVASKHLWESAMVRLAGSKVFADGTLSSRTAQTLFPYTDPDEAIGPFGKAMVSDRELHTHIQSAQDLGMELAVHAIGDGAVRSVLDAWETARKPRSTSRIRIEHCELIGEDDTPRFRRLGVICSVQPCHLLTDIEVLRRHLPDRLSRVLPLRELIQSGLVPGEDLIFGSDAPIVRPNPEDSVLAATMRRRKGMAIGEAIALEQAVDEETAWRCFGPCPAEPRRSAARSSTSDHADLGLAQPDR